MRRNLGALAFLGCGLVASALPTAPLASGLPPGSVPEPALVASFRTDRLSAENGAPVYADGVLYFLTSFPHVLYALDAGAMGRLKVKWEFRPRADRQAEGRSCCSRVDHGPVLHDGTLYVSTLDGHVGAINAATGRPAWDVTLGTDDQPATLTGPPTVVGDLVMIGSGRGDQGQRGWIAALDRSTGRTVWKKYSTGPDRDVGAHRADMPADLGVSSWPPGAWQQGGGGVDGKVLHDADAKLVLHRTGPPMPWNPEQRPGLNHWTSGIFARDAATGAARWFRALSPHNPFAWRDGDADLLVDRLWHGSLRRLLVHPDGNGHLYVVDRLTGELLAADPYTKSAIAKVDLPSGEVHYLSDKMPVQGRQSRMVCPAWSGAAAGPGVASSDGELALIAVSRVCMDLEVRTANFIRGTPYIGANVRLRMPGAGGSVVGWDIAARRARWEIEETFPVVGGIAAAPGDTAVYGTLDGWLKSVDMRDGRLLSRVRVASGILGRPVVWQGKDARVYVAVVTGTRGLFGMAVRDGVDPRDVTAGMGYGALLARLPRELDPAVTLLVFRLP